MVGLVVLERHLWLTLTEIKDADKVSFLDAPISPSGLFGPAVKGFAERFTEAQKASQVMRHFLPSAPAQQLLRVALRLRRLSSPRSLHLPFPPLSLPRLSRREGVHAQPDATPFRSVRAPDPRWRWTLRLRRPPDLQDRKRRESSPATAGPPTKRPLLRNLFSPRSLPGAEGIVFVATGPVQAPMQPSAVTVEKIKHKHSRKESNFPLPSLTSALPPCSRPLEFIQPLATRAEAWQAIPGVSDWVMGIIKRGYSLQFARRPPRSAAWSPPRCRARTLAFYAQR